MSAIAILTGGANKDALPPVVAKHVQGMNDFCKEHDGTPSQSGEWVPFEGRSKFRRMPLVEHGVLEGSGREIWAIDEGRFRCKPSDWLFSGSGGSQVYVFAKLDGGEVKEAFMQGAYGMSLTHIGSSSRLSIQVGGPLCAQAGDPSQGDSIRCNRPLQWDASTQKLDFSPLSEASFPTENGLQKD